MYKNLLLIAVLFITVACSSKTFVVNKNMIDPVSINPNPQLALPPVYYLSNEEITDERRIIRQNRRKVSQFLLGTYVETEAKQESLDTSSRLTEGDRQLLNLTKANNSKSNIRETLNKETSNEVEKSSGFVSKIFAKKSVNALNSNVAEYLKLNKNYNQSLKNNNN